ncbi:uncharacterized protein LOC104859379 isoform X2 [Fukomys damarensis]|uniref:uncharacterized protein LOC104859379 isoform X2 n=1 Tax=Fukomys damarensis TaxID=885580 RepID=UPI0005401513|nr:uncharacterized protein LOC104859379 isoform X2 [Fukomys damarensis]
MAANRGVGTLFLVLLLSSWPETNLQPINTSSGPTTGGSISLKTQDLRAVVDEILVQEILERNKSKLPDTYRTASTLSRVHTEKKKRILVRFRTSLSLRTARSHRPLLKINTQVKQNLTALLGSDRNRRWGLAGRGQSQDVTLGLTSWVFCACLLLTVMCQLFSARTPLPQHGPYPGQ